MPVGDFSTAFGGAATGAGIGTMILPGIGTAVGAGLGGIAGYLFGGKAAPKPYTDPNAGMIDSQIYNLLNSHLGAQMAQRLSGNIQRQAQLRMQKYGNTSGMNSDMLNNLYTKTQGAAENQMIDANLAGAKEDLERGAQGAALAQGQSKLDFGIGQYNQALNDRPDFMQVLGMTGMASQAGNPGGGAFAGLGDWLSTLGNNYANNPTPGSAPPLQLNAAQEPTAPRIMPPQMPAQSLLGGFQ